MLLLPHPGPYPCRSVLSWNINREEERGKEKERKESGSGRGRLGERGGGGGGGMKATAEQSVFSGLVERLQQLCHHDAADASRCHDQTFSGSA